VARRILLLITDLEIGGTPTVVRELAVRLNDPPGAHVEAACLSAWGPVADHLREAGIEVTAMGARSARDVGAIARLVKLIREHQIDTVFSFLIHANVAAAVARVFSREVRFIQSIQTTQPWPWWHWKLQAIAHNAAEAVVVPSESVARVAGEWSRVPRQKIVVIPNAIDVDAFRDMGPRPMPRKIGFLGRLDRIKRVPDLVEALSLLDRQYELHIYGEGAERARIENTIAHFGLGDRVTLHGAIAKPQAAIAAIDILVLPSEAEGFGLVLIEAMAARVPVVATDVPGIRDVVRNGETGLLVPVAQPGEMAAAIRRISEDDALRSRLIDAAFHDVRRRFTWSAVLPQYQRLLGLESS
jgi:glycosyltransferase involved in cell wall biosynthesis